MRDFRTVRERVRKYGLASQSGLKYPQPERQLEKNGFAISKKGIGCLFSSSGKESMKHFISKAIIFKLLLDRGRTVATEVETKDAIVDVLDIDNRIAYEVENGFDENDILKLVSQTELRDVFLIDMKDIPDDVCAAEKFLKQVVI